MTAIFNGRQMTITNIESIDGAIASDLQSRGWEPAFYTLTGKRGGSVICLRSVKTGEFSKF